MSAVGERDFILRMVPFVPWNRVRHPDNDFGAACLLAWEGFHLVLSLGMVCGNPPLAAVIFFGGRLITAAGND